MKTKIIFVSFFILVFILSSCGQGARIPETQPPAATQPPTDIPSPTPTMLPILGLPYSTPIPYPTASVVKSNAVAFVAQDWQKHGPSSLWVANVDGSGERKIVDSIDELDNGLYVKFVAPKWSPDGKWIGYISSGDLWIVSPDGSTPRKILSVSGKDKELIYNYKWSPDSLQIAYAKGDISDAPPLTVGIIDVATGETSEIVSYQSPPTPITLSWSPDGHYLLLSKYGSFFVVNVATRKITAELKSNVCPVYHHGIEWSPNGKWFYHIQVGNGRFSTMQICVVGLNGSSHYIEINGTATSYPVWDKAGDFLYFVVSNTNFSITPIPDYDLRLMRYNAKTQKLERVLSLGKEPNAWAVSISPNKQILEMHITYPESQPTFIFMDMQSLSTTKFNVDLEIPITVAFRYETAWSPDSKNIIIFSGTTHTPDGAGVQPYGAFYALNSQTGKVTIFSGSHNIELGEWVVSPIATTP